MRADIGRGSWARARALLALAALGAGGCYASSQDGVGGESHFLACTRNAQCEHLGPEWSCIEGLCQISDAPATRDDGVQPPAPAANDDRPEPMSTAGSGSGGAGDDPAFGTIAPNEISPLVIFLVDTSGSMERRSDCECVTPGCEECLPNCAAGDRNRYAETLEALTGSFDRFSCERVDRSAFVEGVYDAGYYLPYHRPAGEQRDDGLLDEYGDQLRFGLATFDGWDTWTGAPPLVPPSDFDFERSAGQAGLWSYNPAREIPGFAPETATPIGSVFYPNCTSMYFIDTGIRNADAESGGLALAISSFTTGDVNAAIQRSLLAVRPYGGTPIAAALDDLYYVIAQDPRMAGERESVGVPHVVLITDGYPDDDYRTFGCDCSGGACDGLSALEREAMTCPYPLAEQAARALRCGRDPECTTQLADVHVIGFATRDQTVKDRLDAIALAGGAQGARFANDGRELRAQLDTVLGQILFVP